MTPIDQSLTRAVSAVDGAPLGVSVVVPMFNERDVVPSLVASLGRLERQFAGRYDFEFLLVDDGSRDETVPLLEAALADQPHCRIVRHGQNRGIGAAIQTGLRGARHETVVSMDCDGSYDPALLGELVPLLAPGVDLVTASPYHVAGGVENVPLWRLRLSRLASQLYGVVCWHKLSCYTSCFRAYRRSAVAPIELQNEGFVGVAELLCTVLAQGGQVVEHPALLRSRVAGTSKMRVARASLGHLRLMASLAKDRLLHRAAPTPTPSPGREPRVSAEATHRPAPAEAGTPPYSYRAPAKPELELAGEPGARAPGC